jgi:hypothetical protein
MGFFHRGSGTIDSLQSPIAIKNEDAVRHGVERGFPLLLATRHHLKEFRLRDTDCKPLGHCFNEGRLIVSPMTNPIRLMNAQNTPE